jgi:hypothetical protein
VTLSLPCVDFEKNSMTHAGASWVGHHADVVRIPERADILVTDLFDHRSDMQIWMLSPSRTCRVECLHPVLPSKEVAVMSTLHITQGRPWWCVVCSVLGMELLPKLDYATRHLLKLGAVVVPAQVQVHAALCSPASLLAWLSSFVVLVRKALSRSGMQPSTFCSCCLMQVWAMLAEMRITDVSGFDVSALNRYRWHPGQESTDLDRCHPDCMCTT